MPLHKKARSTLLYGDSGETKTTQLYHFIKWYRKNNPDKKVRIICADGGGIAPFEDSGMIERKEVDVYDITNTPTAYATAMMLSEGYWPKRLKGGKRTLKKDDSYREDTEQGKVGLIAVEGMTAISTLWEQHLAHSQQSGFKHSFTFEEEGYEVGGLQQGHFGLMQNELYKLIVKGFGSLNVDHVLWTARVCKGESRTGDTEYGPKGSGQAKTSEYPAWFGDCLHLATEVIDGNPAKVAWFYRHNDANTGIPYLCKLRVMPELMPEVLKKFPNGYVKLGFKRGIDVLYQFLDEIKGKQEMAILKEISKESVE